jgi:hypothetical protein
MTGVNLRATIRAAAAAVAMCMLAATGSPVSAQQAASVPASPKPATAKSPQKALDKPLWHELSRPQQVALEPLAVEWDKMEGVRKQKWLEIANRFSSMKVDEQQRVHERMRDWIKMTPEERRVVRENYTRTKKIDPGKKSAKWEQYQQLPEEQKKKLAADAAAKKQVANLPSKPHGKTVAPGGPGTAPAPACPAGTVKNSSAPTPACVPAPAPLAAPAGAPPAAAAPAATAPAATSSTTTSPGNPPAPVPNAK